MDRRLAHRRSDPRASGGHARRRLVRPRRPPRRRAGQGPDADRREGRDQRRDGRLPARRLPGGGHRRHGAVPSRAAASTGRRRRPAGAPSSLVVNGPIRHQLGMSSAHSALAGPDRASVCIGRAVRLVLRNLLDVRPGELDRSTLGHPGKLSWCVAEDEEGAHPWLPLAAERGVPDGVSAVTAFAASGPRQIMNEWTTDPVEILATVVAEIKATMLHYSIWAGNYAVVFPPQLCAVFHRAGWSKADVRRFVYEHAVVQRSDWEAVGKAAVVSDANRHRRVPRPAVPRPPAGGGGGRRGRRLRRRHPAVARPQVGRRHRADRRVRRLLSDRSPVDHRAPPRPRPDRLAAVARPRPVTLVGATVGILSNGKANTRPFFDHLERAAPPAVAGGRGRPPHQGELLGARRARADRRGRSLGGHVRRRRRLRQLLVVQSARRRERRTGRDTGGRRS